MVQNAQGIGGATGDYPAWPQSIQRRDRLNQRPAQSTDNDFLLALFAESRPDLALLPEPVRASLIRMQFESQLSQYRSQRAGCRRLDPGTRRRSAIRSRWAAATSGREPEEHRLLDLAIRAEWRGQGIGSAVLEQLRGEAAGAGVPLRLSVWQGNEGAIRFYRRLGFVEEFAEDEANGGYLHMKWTTRRGERQTGAAMSDQPSTPSYQAYADRVGTEFSMQLADGSQVPLVLTGCTAIGPDILRAHLQSRPASTDRAGQLFHNCRRLRSRTGIPCSAPTASE